MPGHMDERDFEDTPFYLSEDNKIICRKCNIEVKNASDLIEERKNQVNVSCMNLSLSSVSLSSSIVPSSTCLQKISVNFFTSLLNSSLS